ncbi:hypothetical protein NFI96_002228 [Prochilodus magdalenae]|nr:hypothetical protein NFI96_002228 [Prochilodus magdalenae]
MSSVASFTILRQQGTFGNVRVAWEILSENFPQGLPPMEDLILAATFPPAVMLQPHARRHHSGTDAFFFSGLPGAYGTISPEDQSGEIPRSLANFTFSAWLMPRSNTDGFIVSKGICNGTMYYGVKVQTNESHVSVMLHYTTVGYNSTQVARATAEKFVEDNVWVHVIIAVEDGIIEFYLDGSPMPGGIKSLKGEAIMNDVAPVQIGSDPDGLQLFTGLLQDVRLYFSRLNQTEIRELHGQPAKTDLRNVSGYLAYRQEEKSKSFVVETHDDREEEGEEVFYLQLVAVHGGARLPAPRPTARLRVTKSDNANGLFGFTGACIPDISEEGSTVSCVVERTRGALDSVYVNYTVSQLGSPAVASNGSDFANATGSILFLPAQRSEITCDYIMLGNVLNLLVLDDDIPEFDEFFQVKLVSAQSADGKQGSTPTSGASIDPDNAINNITIKASDHPYGLLQFQTAPISMAMIRPAVEEARISVQEEAGVLRLPVARAQGLLGRVLVAYRTIPFTAISPKDYLDAEGLLDFLPGDRLKYINVTIIDNAVPELDKVFRVELYNPEGGANLGIASHITVTIAASDEAHGVFQFSADSLAVNGTEPEEGRSTVVLQVIRTFGALSNVTVYWEADAASEGELIYRSGNLTFSVGQTVGSIYLLISQDDVPELDKSFRVRLSNVSHGRLGNRTVATVTVLASDDPYGQFVFAESSRPVRVAEADTLVTLTIQRRKGLMGRVQVTYRTLRDTDPAPYSTPGVGRANAGSDFIAISELVTFSANQSEANVTVRILDDQDPERAESVFVELSSVTLVEGVQARPVALSPRLGLRNVSVAQVIIEASDDAFGVLQLSSPAVSVPEYYVGPIINVTRTGGIFADVSVKFRAVPLTARVGEDYSVASSDVVLLEGESSKPVPILIINDVVPELEETFRIELLNQTTGGAFLGELTQAIITILPSDDPYGSFVFQAEPITIEEPGVNSFEVSLPIVRNAGTIGHVTVQWQATVNGRPATGDLRPLSGEVSFAPGETMKTLRVEVLADDVPEIEEIIRVELTGATNGGSIGAEKAVNIISLYLPNDNPYGTVYFEQAVYRVQEALGRRVVRKTIEFFITDDTEPEDNETMQIGLVRTEGGSRIHPSSDTVTILILANDYAAGLVGFNPASRSVIVREGERLPLLVERTPPAIGNVTVEWRIEGPQPSLTFVDISGVLFFSEGMLNDSIVLQLLDDGTPEEREEYRVVLSNIQTKGVTATGVAALDVQGREAVVSVEASDEPFGMLSIAPSSRSIYTEEKNTTIRIYINREFGASGAVNISYETVKGSLQDLRQTEGALAEPGQDFLYVSGSVVMQDGQTSVSIPITIVDDSIPELQEFFLINITSAVLISTLPTAPKLDTQGLVAEVRINANDGIRGIIGWQSIAYEVNETIGVLTLVAYRHAGTYGNVSVFFYAQNLEAQLGLDFNATASMLNFMNGERYKFVEVLILDDPIPEGDEKFQLILTNPSSELELGENTTATVTILANDDGHGIISFNNSEHFLLREPTSVSGLGQSVATLYVVRNPPQGVFGTVTVQFSITDANGTLYTDDLTPSDGFVVLEDGVQYKTLEIWAVLDAEPEMNETFTVTLFNPTGGARLGEPTQTLITVLQNQAPLGLFRIAPSINRTLSSLTVEETAGTVYLTVSRSNGLDSAVSVEFEAQSDTAFGMKGDYPYLAVYQRFRDALPAGWCSVPSADSALLLRLGGLNSSLVQDQITLYVWQGVFVPVEAVSIQSPSSCVGFTVNGTAYVAVSHRDTTESPAANVSLFRIQPDLNLTLEQTLAVGSPDVKYFSVKSQQYFIASNQVFAWSGSSFSLLHNLELQNITSLSPFTRANGNGQYLAACRNRASSTCFIYQWSNESFQNPQPLPVSAKVKQLESLHMGGDTFLLAVTEVVNKHAVDTTRTAFSDTSRHEGSDAYLGYIESTKAKTLGVSAQRWSEPHHHSRFGGVYLCLFFYDSSSGELFFQPGVSELEVAVNIINDDAPEEEERFRLTLKNPKGGAEIGFRGQVTVVIPANDDAYGIIGFAQNSLFREVDELERDNPVTLSVERRRGTFGRLTVRWTANGSLEDIFPTSGVVTFSEGQAVATISLSVLADSIPEMAEKVTITLTDVTTVGILDPSRRALIDPQRARADLTIKANGSPYGVIGWHLDSQYFITAEPQRSPTNITLSIVRDQGASGDVVVYYTTRPALSLLPVNQASEGQDYVAKQATVVMMEKAAVALVTITILPDDIPELAETFLVNITQVELLGGQTGAGQPSIRRPGMEIAEVTIQENDDPRGVLQFNVSRDASGVVFAHEVPPPGNVLYLPVVRQAGRSDRVMLFWEAQPVIATIEDFTPTLGNITFEDGQASAVIEITIIDDAVVEAMESFLVKLTRVTGGARLGADTSVVINIPANDSPLGRFGFQELTVTISEPQFADDPASMVNLTVVRSSGGIGTVYLIWLLDQKGRDDLQPHNGTLVFNGTESRKTLVIQALGDAVLEGEERFTVHLMSAENEAVIDPTRNIATVVIRADRGALGIVGIADSSKNVLIGEPQGTYNGTALISLVRGPGIFGEIELYWNITPAIASEFLEISGKVIMRDRQSAATIQLKALDDDLPEERRVYEFSLVSLTPGSEISPGRQRAIITMAASDLPYGTFSFFQPSLSASEEDRSVNITVVRSMGLLGSVWVSYHTEGRSAVSGLDFEQSSGRLLFGPGDTFRVITLKILDDLLPEGPEEFYLNITQVQLLNDSALDFTIREQGLQIDQPPAIGNLSSIMILIQKNDNVEGILEFHPSYTNITVEEDIGTLSIPVLRRVGTYGQVTADFISRGVTAQPGSDYILPNGSITFRHGQNLSHINISIVDDLDREYNEMFEIQLTAATGGAILGAQLVSQITIAKSDSPSGVVRFVNQSLITIANPNSTMRLSLVLERAGGLVGDAMITWNILGPNSNEVLPSVNSDIGEPVNGTFHFRDGEGGVRLIELQILPHGEVEVEEAFVVRLSILSGEMDIDPKAGSVTLRIAKFGDPNGIVQFTEQDLRERVYSEPADGEGPLNISLLITRREGVMGNITVFWEVLSDSDMTGDFAALHGSTIILAGQRVGEIALSLLPDSVPELEETYTVRLSAVEGGAELDAERSTTRIIVRANDEPHGVFALPPQWQALFVNATDRSRHLALNISRLAGTFGNVSVGYRISYPTPGQSFTEDRSTGSILARDGEKSVSVTVPVSTQVFFVTGFNITLELTNATLVGALLSSPPRVQLEARIAVVSVPEEAANAEVGFASLALQVSDVVSGQCEAIVSRTGLYGDVDVQWRAGFPPGQTPPGYQQGTVTPSSGMVTLSHGQRSKIIPLSAAYNISEPVAHAVHLTSAESKSAGGARLRSGYTVAEVEPLGVYRFSPESQHLVIEEDVQTVTLYVQRLYGYRSNRTQLFYKTWPGSASPSEDFTPMHDGQLLFEGRQTSAPIHVSILDDSLTEPNETFYVNLTDVRVLSASYPSPSAHPRIIPENSISTITILANDAVSGFLSIGPALVHASEDGQEGVPPQKVVLRVRRTVGQTGVVSVRVRAYAGGLMAPGLDTAPFLQERNLTWAREGEDFALDSQIVTLLEGQREAEVSLFILDDQEPEGQEVFYVYLSEVEGGAQIVSLPDEIGFTSFAKIVILGSDLHNGIVGFSLSSQSGQALDEDSDNRTAILILQRQENRAFEDVFVYWRATFSPTTPTLVNQGVNLTRELQQTSGRALCRRGEILCLLHLEVRPDQDPEFAVWFLVEIYDVGEGAAINQTARFANITLLESDDPRGLVYFAVGSRLPVATLKATMVSLQVYRDASMGAAISVKYTMQELPKAESVGPTLIWPAVAGMDFVMAEGTLTFDVGQHSTGLDVALTPNIGSSNPTPKRFRVTLSDATGGARVHPMYGVANVTLVSDAETQSVWALLDQLYQPLDETIINKVLQGLINKVSVEITHEQLTAVLDAVGQTLTKAEQTPLEQSSRGLTYDLLCALAKPTRTDTRGLSHLSEVAERFAFSLVTSMPCGAEGQRGKTILDSCPYLTIAAHHWYPTQINGHTFTGRNGDTFTLPETLLEVPALPGGDMAPSACQKVHFTEYSTEHWFLTNKASALNDKVFSVSIQGRGSRPLMDGKEVVYRIHTPDRRVKPRQSLCLLWNQAAESWLSDGQFCHVVDDSENFVECACTHLSIYTAYAETDTLSSYNEAFYAAGFICISGFALAIMSHVLCSRFPMFAAKLLTHMMVACLGMQICFLVSAFRGRMFSEDSCAALGLFFHYFHLSQFSWMLIQAVNFWQTLVMNDEHTERRYLLYFLLSWGLPALVIIMLVIVLLGGYGWNIHDVYGLVHGDLCFIPNVYAALCTAAFVPLICLVGVLVVFIHAYHVTQQWKAYDDVYRGRTNSSALAQTTGRNVLTEMESIGRRKGREREGVLVTNRPSIVNHERSSYPQCNFNVVHSRPMCLEIPMVLYLFALVSLVCLWAGLHMAYRYLWMLILLVIFNVFLGLYVFAVYFIMHNQLCWPAKASYTVEMNGHSGPDGVFQSTGATTVGGEEISKSTQNLISAMEEISADWERASLRPSSQPSSVFKQGAENGTYPSEGGFINTNLVQDEESQEFDDLIFALKTGSGLNMSDNESIPGSHDGGSVANSQIVELRRIPIADTHL